MDVRGHISRMLISEEQIRRNLRFIFVDSVFLDLQFRITHVSENILQNLGYSDTELQNKSLDCLFSDASVSGSVIKGLRNGLCQSRAVRLRSKSGGDVSFHISGFYLGMISDINNVIILTLKPVAQDSPRDEVFDKKAELDKFIYRAGHDLRGPLATIKGLINLMKNRDNDAEIDRLVQLVDVHAATLDERLFHLMYLSHQEEKRTDQRHEQFMPSIIETRMRKMIEKNAFLDFLEFHFSGIESDLCGVDCETLYEAMENVLAYVLALPVTAGRPRIFCRAIKSNTSFRITFGAVGFVISDQLTDALNIPEFSYTDLVRYPQMINLYTAAKKAGQLQSTINVSILSSERQRIRLIVPLPDNPTCSV